jgi:glutathione S-transferase
MPQPIVFGVPLSTRTDSVRLALEETGTPYEFFRMPPGSRGTPEFMDRQPFAKIPSFEHGDFRLYETQAILRYVDQVFGADRLTPTDPRQRARMNQCIGIVDDYGYDSISVGIILERMLKPKVFGTETNEANIAAALPKARVCVSEFDRLLGDAPYLAGDTLSLADLMVAPLLLYLRFGPERALLDPHPNLTDWLGRMCRRESLNRVMPEWALGELRASAGRVPA